VYTGDIESLKRELVEAMKLLVYRGLTNPLGGNASFRIGGYMWITPSGLPKHSLSTNDLVLYDLSRDTYMGLHKPSIEYRVHKTIYERVCKAKAVIHAHPPLSTALFNRLGLEWVRETLVEIQYSVYGIAIIDYYHPGSIELAKAISENVSDKVNVVVSRRHGLFVWSKSIASALDTIVSLEDAARYYITLNRLGATG